MTTPAEKGIQAAKEEVQRAHDLECHPTWEKIAEVHRHASEARLEVIKSQAAIIVELEAKLQVLVNTIEIIGTINKY